MFKQIQVTVYDVFGYLLPGTMLLVATAILCWTVVFPAESVTLANADNTYCRLGLSSFGAIRLSWWLVVLLAYFSGHMAQAMGNALVSCIKSVKCSKTLLWQVERIPEPIMTMARVSAVSRFGAGANDMDAIWLYRLCDAGVAQFGCVEDRELYQHREGFYRGLTISFLMLALALAVRMIVPSASFLVEQKTLIVPIAAMTFLALISLIGAVLSFLRYRRFYSYRVTSAMLGFIILSKKKELETEGVKGKSR